MLYPRIIRWLAKLPPPFALGLLWWSEITAVMCSLAGGYLLSIWLFSNLRPSFQQWLFVLALLTYFLVFYILHFAFSRNSQMMESLIHIHRHGGLEHLEFVLGREKRSEDGNGSCEDQGGKEANYDPLEPPMKIRASAGSFKIRYFIMLPTMLVLYLLAFTSTIYNLFARQIQTWDPGMLVLLTFAAAIVSLLCFWQLMPVLPGYVSVRKLIGFQKVTGE